ncbi:MAG: hypothetical protein LE168_01695 [Endomicrobium sp.]|nr:hypothetical protein [Endomicrobium sp.]
MNNIASIISLISITATAASIGTAYDIAFSLTKNLAATIWNLKRNKFFKILYAAFFQEKLLRFLKYHFRDCIN